MVYSKNFNKVSQTLYGANAFIFVVAMARNKHSLAHCIFRPNQNQKSCFTWWQLLEYVVGIHKFTIAIDFKWIVAPESDELDANIFSRKKILQDSLYHTSVTTVLLFTANFKELRLDSHWLLTLGPMGSGLKTKL